MNKKGKIIWSLFSNGWARGSLVMVLCPVELEKTAISLGFHLKRLKHKKQENFKSSFCTFHRYNYKKSR